MTDAGIISTTLARTTVLTALVSLPVGLFVSSCHCEVQAEPFLLSMCGLIAECCLSSGPASGLPQQPKAGQFPSTARRSYDENRAGRTRSRTGVENDRLELRSHPKPRLSMPRRRVYRPWSNVDKKLLRRLAGRRTVKAMSRELKRTEAAIRYKAHIMGVRLALK